MPQRIVMSGGVVLNNPEVVAKSTNKLECFKKLQENPNVRIPEFTTEIEVARRMVSTGLVVCRTMLRAHSGAGIVLASTPEELVQCPLYVKYIKKAQEFRVHVARTPGGYEVLDVQEKRRRSDYDGEVNNQVRNHQNGWVYCRQDITEPAELRQMACDTIQTLGLDFGAVDIIYNNHYRQCWVLEVNTAPGLEGTSLDIYLDYFKRMLQQ